MRLRRQKSERRTTYYNKRPAEEKGKEQRQWAKRWAFDSGRSESGEAVDWVEGSTDGGRWREMEWKAGGYLQRLNVWRLEVACVHHCRSPSDRLGGETRWLQWRPEGGGEWWPRNRRPDELEKRFANEMRPDRNTAARRAWYIRRLTRCLCLPSAQP